MSMEFTRSEVAEYYRARVPGLKQRGEEWRGACPLHDGKRHSFAGECAHGDRVITFDKVPARPVSQVIGEAHTQNSESKRKILIDGLHQVTLGYYQSSGIIASEVLASITQTAFPGGLGIQH